MARSIDPAPKAVRGFVPARNDEERYLKRHIEDLARTASSRGIARYSGFLSDREQQLAQAALNRTEMPEDEIRFDGGWPGAERKLLCLEPVDSYPASPLCCVRLQCRALPGAQLPVHKDYLGSLMGLELRREALYLAETYRDRALMDDVLQREAPDAVIHFAANSLVGESMREPMKYYDNNVGGACTLLASMAEQGVRKIVFSSTAAVYGEPERIPIRENDKTIPTNPYGETKLAMERMFHWADVAYLSLIHI